MAKLWRYMDVAKFVSLLQEQSLYFCRADCLGDPFEGSLPAASAYTTLAGLSGTERAALFGTSAEHANMIIDQMIHYTKKFRETVFCNCWHVNDHESAAMWRLYCQASESICIQTTYGTLAERLPEKVHIGMVEYRDYATDVVPPGNMFNPFLTKRKSFEHEREARAIVWDVRGLGAGDAKTLPIQAVLTPDGRGIKIPVEVHSVVEAVYVSPTSAMWFRDVVAGLVAKYGLTLGVTRSDLDRTPLF